MLKPLDPLLHQQLRLAVMSQLVARQQADFKELKEQTKATAGNLSIQIKKLEEAGYLSVKKRFKNNYPNTTCHLTGTGLKAFEDYVQALKDYIEPNGEE